MSQWHGYNQYQNPNTWEANINNQYINQNPNQQYNPGNQYVSFTEFVSQMQSNEMPLPSGSNYNNGQYQSYPGQYNNHTNVSSTSQNTQSDNYEPNMSVQNGSNFNQMPASSSEAENKSNIMLKSNLTATATEFVPKSSTKQQHNRNQKPESYGTYNGYNNKGNRNKSSDKNWRDRPSSSSQNSPAQSQNGFNNHDQEPSTRNNDRNQESNQRTYEPNPRNQDTKSYERKPHENNRNKSKSKYKDNDPGRTYYNSSSNGKNNHDPRNNKESRNRNWIGSQRVRPAERNYADDEQFANTYLQFKDEKAEKGGKVQGTSSPMRNKSRNYHSNNQGANTDLTQRERLSEQLDKGTLECLVCCERVKQMDPVWSCGNCYHVFHLRCIRKWAMSSMQDGKWRCPACQNTSATVPTEYRCLCGGVRSPEWSRGSVGAHTCGAPCRRPRACPHPCALLCHPGPCPPCQATVSRQCGCGAETRSVMCSSKLAQVCSGTCHKMLNCNKHECGKDCHEGPCEECTETVTQECYCPARATRTLPCDGDSAFETAWSCGAACGRVLRCGAHVCHAPCHAPPCHPCKRDPALLTTCPCGKTKVPEGKRKSCTDPIPLCGKICAKPLNCGPDGDKHFCKLECHEGECPVCPDKTVLQCRCGHSSREVPCAELPQMLNNVFCQKKCNKKLSCGRHRCRTLCCAADSHRCPATCGRSLPCQLHRCEQLCHTGHCGPCPILSFEELRCACGAEAVLPPVRCGTRPPACSAPCTAPRDCGHEPLHNCHAGPCPPCVVLTARRCHGGHEERKTIPCSQEEFSCGLPCGKPLPCGKHTCIKTCHKGPCDTAKCAQPCAEKRPACGHECGAVCHSGAGDGSPCPSLAPCRRPVRATCPCGRRSAERACSDNASIYNKMMSTLAATKIQEGGSVDLSELSRPGANLKTLECDDECRVEQRTRQMALALQIRNPDVSAKLAPRYSDHVRATAAKDPAFARQIHERLTDLVHLAKKSKQKTRSHSFPSMNWQKRQFIHELCEHFGCESVAYDAEPNRNVVATADKERSWLPAMSVLEVLAREAGKRRVPGPVLRQNAPVPVAPTTSAPAPQPAKPSTGWASTPNVWAARSQLRQAEPKIDYFDNPPE